MKFYSTCACVALLWLTAGCGKGSDAGTSYDQAPTTSEIQFKTYTYTSSNKLVGSAGDFFRDDDLVYTDSLAIVLPESDSKHDFSALNRAIAALCLDSVSDNVFEAMKVYVRNDEAKQLYKLQQVPSTDVLDSDGYLIITGSVVNFNPMLLVYEVCESSYNPGAAHGLTTRNYVNYSLKDNKVLTGAEIFKRETLDELVKEIAQRAQEQANIIGPTTIESLPQDENFYISNTDEIVFVYQPYEVASFSQGLISIRFYPEEIVDFLTPYARTLFGLNDL